MENSLAFFSLLVLIGCMGQGPTPPEVDPHAPGTVQGTVGLLHDLYTPSPLPNDSGVTVVFQPGPLATVSEINGSWQMTNVPPGTYALRFSRPGYFAENMYNFQFTSAGGTYHFQEVFLSPVASVSVALDSMTFDSQLRVAFHGSIASPDTLGRPVGFIISKFPINTASLPFEFTGFAATLVPPDSMTFSGYHPTFGTYSVPELRGMTVYAVAFALPRCGWHPATFPASGLFLFDTPGISFSSQRSFTVPPP